MGVNMKRTVSSKTSGVPMLEIVISIGIFTIISVFLLQMFLSANALQEKSEDVGKSIIRAENIAETIKATNDARQAAADLGLSKAFVQIEATEKAYDLQKIEKEEKENSKEVYLTYYNSNWEQIDNLKSAGAKYCAIVWINEKENGLQEIEILFYHLGKYTIFTESNENVSLYQLHIENYRKQ